MLSDWGLRSFGLGRMGWDEQNHPFATLKAKEDVKFHRPEGTLEKEKAEKGGEVTHF